MIFMKYYLLQIAQDTSYPIKNWGPFTNFLNDNCPIDKLSGNRPHVEATDWQMLSKAKLTDTIYAFNMGAYLISDRFRKILDAHKMPPHQYFEGTVTHKQKKYENYACIHVPILPVSPSPLDFSRTEFFVLPLEDSHRDKETPVFVTDLQGAEDQSVYILEQSKVYLTSAATRYDLFRFYHLINGFVASEALCNTLLSEKITGIQILDVDIWGA